VVATGRKLIAAVVVVAGLAQQAKTRQQPQQAAATVGLALTEYRLQGRQ